MKRRVYIGGFKEFTRMTLPQTGVFIAHDFSGRDREDDKRDAPRQVKDYRLAYEDGLRDVGLIPVYAPVHSGTILETLVKEMINTDAGIFDVSFGRKYNANVLIELGISLALNHPTVVVAETTDNPVIDFLHALQPFYYQDDIDLDENIGDEVQKRISNFNQQLKSSYCAICQQEACRCRRNLQTQEKSYLLLGADGTETKRRELSHNVKRVVREFNMESLKSEEELNTNLCTWLYRIKRSKLVLLYSQELGNRHHGPENALTMVQLGLCIGANVRWRFVIDEKENPPTDIVNYIDIRVNNSKEVTRENIAGAIGALNSETDPYQGTYDVLEPPIYEEVEGKSIDIEERANIESTANESQLSNNVDDLQSVLEEVRKGGVFNTAEEAETSSDVISIDLDSLQTLSNEIYDQAEYVKHVNQLIEVDLDMLRNGGWLADEAESFYHRMDTNLMPRLAKLHLALLQASETCIDISNLFTRADEEAGSYL